MAQITFEVSDEQLEEYKKAIEANLSWGGQRKVTVKDVVALMTSNFQMDLIEIEILAEKHCEGDCLEEDEDIDFED